jgi:hypothetical protein
MRANWRCATRDSFTQVSHNNAIKAHEIRLKKTIIYRYLERFSVLFSLAEWLNDSVLATSTRRPSCRMYSSLEAALLGPFSEAA